MLKGHFQDCKTTEKNYFCLTKFVILNIPYQNKFRCVIRNYFIAVVSSINFHNARLYVYKHRARNAIQIPKKIKTLDVTKVCK